jgi:hypothetical protein
MSESQSGGSKPVPRLMNDRLCTSASSTPNLHDISLTMNEGRSYRLVASTHPARWEAVEGRSVRFQRWKEHLVFTSTTMEPQQADDVAQLYIHNINRIRNHLPYFFCTISYLQIEASTKSATIQAGRPVVALRSYSDRVSIHPERSHPFLFSSYRQKEMMIKKRERKRNQKKKERKESTHIHLAIFTYFFSYTYRFVQYQNRESNREQLRL